MYWLFWRRGARSRRRRARGCNALVVVGAMSNNGNFDLNGAVTASGQVHDGSLRSDDNLIPAGGMSSEPRYLPSSALLEGGGTVCLRPNGASNTAGEARVGLNGNFRGKIAVALSITDGQIDAMWTAATVL